MDVQTRHVWKRNDDGQDEDLISQTSGDQETSTYQQDSSSSEQPELAKPIVYTSQWAALFIVVNVTIGVGLLAIPFAMQQSGIVTSMILQTVFLALIVITCIMCVELTVKSDVKSYHEIIQAHCHPLVYLFTQATILMIVFGTAVAYIVTIGDQSDRIFLSRYDATFCHTWYMNRRFIMSALTLLAIKPLCSARTVDFLKYGSFLGVATMGFIFYVVLDKFINSSQIPPDVNYIPKNISDITAILPVLCLGYQCHLSLVPTVATVHKRQKPKSFATVTIAMVIAMVIYSAISILAVLAFGSTIKPDLTENFSGNGLMVSLTIAVVGLKCILTLPAAFLPARIILIDTLTNSWAKFAQFSEPIRRIGVTMIFLDVALLTAIYVPNILIAVNLLGSLSVMFIFTLPGLAYISLVRRNRLSKQIEAGGDAQNPTYSSKDKMKLMISYFMIVFGILMTFAVLYKSISEMMTSKSSAPLCRT